jgi:hypothetical protein
MNERSKDRLSREEHSTSTSVTKPEAGDITWSDEVIQRAVSALGGNLIDIGALHWLTSSSLVRMQYYRTFSTFFSANDTQIEFNQCSDTSSSRAYAGTHSLNTRLIRVVKGEASFIVCSLPIVI